MTAKKVLSTLLTILLGIIIVLAAGFTFTTLATRDVNNVSSLAGFTPLTVQTDSMAPTFNSGDLIVIKKVDPSTLEVGDIITFHTIIENQYALNTHRIDAIEELNGYRSYTTKGDNNAIADTHVISDGDIVGKMVFRIGGAGKVMDFLASSVGFFVVIVLPMLAFFVYQVYHLITVALQLKKATALEAAQELAKADVTDEQLKAKEAELEAALAEAQRLREEMENKLRNANHSETPVDDSAAKEDDSAAKKDESAAKIEEKIDEKIDEAATEVSEIEIAETVVTEADIDTKDEARIEPQNSNDEVRIEPQNSNEKSAEDDVVNDEAATDNQNQDEIISQESREKMLEAKLAEMEAKLKRLEEAADKISPES